MTIQRHAVDFEILTPDILDQWREIPPAIVSDMMNRTQCMAARIKPLNPGTVLAGQARTATCMVGDNSAAHSLVPLLEAGQILVLDAGGFPDVAIWGGILTRAAMAQKAGITYQYAIQQSCPLRIAVRTIRQLPVVLFAVANAQLSG